MANHYFQFKKFIIWQQDVAMKVTTDACLFGAWCAKCLQSSSFQSTKKALDIGTGTGLLSLMIAQKTSLQIDAVEIDESAFNQSKLNFSNSDFSHQLTAIHADIKTYLNKTQYDIIFSNPPFYQNHLSSPNELKNIALHGSELTFEELCICIDKNLQQQGAFFILLPAFMLEKATETLRKFNLHLHNIVTVKQSEKHDNFRVMMMGKRYVCDNPTELSIAIKNADNEYSKEFEELLMDYYLKL